MIVELPYGGKVDRKGKLTINNKKDFIVYLCQFVPFGDKEYTPVEVLVRKKKSRRSVQQNRLWWLYMTIISEEIGMSKEKLHEICKFKFLKRETVLEATGEVVEYLESTTNLGKMEFSDLVNDLQKWAREMFGIILPLPDEQLELSI